MAENEASEEEENEEADLIADQQICRLDPIRWYSGPFQIFQELTSFVVTSCMVFPHSSAMFISGSSPEH